MSNFTLYHVVLEQLTKKMDQYIAQTRKHHTKCNLDIRPSINLTSNTLYKIKRKITARSHQTYFLVMCLAQLPDLTIGDETGELQMYGPTYFTKQALLKPYLLRLAEQAQHPLVRALLVRGS